MTRVSNHALLCYLEQVQGIDIEAMRAAIEARLDRAANAAAELGVFTYGVRLDGVGFIVRSGTVTTILPKLADGSRFRALGARDHG